jgi:hypothetical protein
MNYAQRMVFTYKEFLELPAKVWDAIQYIPSIREELKKKYGDNK